MSINVGNSEKYFENYKYDSNHSNSNRPKTSKNKKVRINFESFSHGKQSPSNPKDSPKYKTDIKIDYDSTDILAYQNIQNKNEIIINIINDSKNDDNKIKSGERNFEMLKIQKSQTCNENNKENIVRPQHSRNCSSTSSKVNDPLIKKPQDDFHQNYQTYIESPRTNNKPLEIIQKFEQPDGQKPDPIKKSNHHEHNLSSISNFIDPDFCLTCLIDIPLRTKHCQYCDQCVSTFDHHCSWISNCVGEKNKWLFHIFLFFTSLKLAMSICIVSYNNLGSFSF